MNDFIQYILHLFQRGIYFAVPAILLCVLVLAAAWGIARKKGQPFPWQRAVALLLLISWLGLPCLSHYSEANQDSGSGTSTCFWRGERPGTSLLCVHGSMCC